MHKQPWRMMHERRSRSGNANTHATAICRVGGCDEVVRGEKMGAPLDGGVDGQERPHWGAG